MDITIGGPDYKFRPRAYQMPLIQAFEKSDKKRFVVCWPRRAGKDITIFNLLIRAALRKKGVYFYVFPTYAQAKRVIWDSITNTGERFLDYIDQDLIANSNSQELKIILANGSLIQLAGSNNIDALRGTNPQGIIFSEYAWQDPGAYQALRPILLANHGWAIFASTPFGQNHFYDLYRHAEQSPDWFCEKLTINDTKHISFSEIEKEREEGLISEDMIQQEYFTSFNRGVEGAYYAKYVEKMILDNRIGDVPYDIGSQVHTSWDLGIRDATSIVFFETVAGSIRIIDFYENSKEGLEHYVQVVKSKPYLYGKHIAPHDIAVREFTSGIARIDKARQLGINFTVAPNLSVEDGIEAVRTMLSKVYIDKTKCDRLIKGLENYRQEWDNKHKVYKNRPLHDQWSHIADALRYMAVSLPKTRDGLSPEELDKRYRDAMGANDDPLYGFKRW
jgi:phage terminase large subunit